MGQSLQKQMIKRSVTSTSGNSKQSKMVEMIILVCNIREKFKVLPDHLIQIILDYANLVYSVSITREEMWGGSENQNEMYLSIPLKCDVPYIRPYGIQVVVESCDQGWSSYPDEHGLRTSHTFGELAIKRDGEEIGNNFIY